MYTPLLEKGYTVESGFVFSSADSASWVYPASCVKAFAAHAATFFLGVDKIIATEKWRNMISLQPPAAHPQCTPSGDKTWIS
jgi:hypothetical protein